MRQPSTATGRLAPGYRSVASDQHPSGARGGLSPEGHVCVLALHAELFEEPHHVGIVLLVEHHESRGRR